MFKTTFIFLVTAVDHADGLDVLVNKHVWKLIQRGLMFSELNQAHVHRYSTEVRQLLMEDHLNGYWRLLSPNDQPKVDQRFRFTPVANRSLLRGATNPPQPYIGVEIEWDRRGFHFFSLLEQTGDMSRMRVTYVQSTDWDKFLDC